MSSDTKKKLEERRQELARLREKSKNASIDVLSVRHETDLLLENAFKDGEINGFEYRQRRAKLDATRAEQDEKVLTLLREHQADLDKIVNDSVLDEIKHAEENGVVPSFDAIASSDPEKFGWTQCNHCRGHGSSLQDPPGVEKCTECAAYGARGLVPHVLPGESAFLKALRNNEGGGS